YLQEEVPQPLVPLVRDLLGRLRDGDQRAARRFDRWMANSTAVRGRIETYYGVTASAIEIVHPPVDVESFAANDERSDLWLFVCAEALASGAPVVALAAGGIFDIVRDGEEGVLVDVPEPRAFAEGVLRAERARFEPKALRDSARRFDVSRFRERVRAIVDDAREK